jgi:uncharacterized protein (TIGR02598 family)
MKLPLPLRQRSRAFSLLEVVVALGVVSFCLVGVVALLPAGLNSQKQATDQSFGTQALSSIAAALRGVHPSKTGTNLEFLPPLDKLTVGDGTSTYYLLGNGTLVGILDPSARGRVRIQQVKMTDSLLGVHVSVAWPAQAQFSGNKWTKAAGSTSTYLYLNLPK